MTAAQSLFLFSKFSFHQEHFAINHEIQESPNTILSGRCKTGHHEEQKRNSCKGIGQDDKKRLYKCKCVCHNGKITNVPGYMTVSGFILDAKKMTVDEKYIFDYNDSKYMAVKNEIGKVVLSDITPKEKK